MASQKTEVALTDAYHLDYNRMEIMKSNYVEILDERDALLCSDTISEDEKEELEVIFDDVYETYEKLMEEQFGEEVIDGLMAKVQRIKSFEKLGSQYAAVKLIQKMGISQIIQVNLFYHRMIFINL